jgi:hypothetical protein
VTSSIEYLSDADFVSLEALTLPHALWARFFQFLSLCNITFECAYSEDVEPYRSSCPSRYAAGSCNVRFLCAFQRASRPLHAEASFFLVIGRGFSRTFPSDHQKWYDSISYGSVRVALCSNSNTFVGSLCNERTSVDEYSRWVLSLTCRNRPTILGNISWHLVALD